MPPERASPSTGTSERRWPRSPSEPGSTRGPCTRSSVPRSTCSADSSTWPWRGIRTPSPWWRGRGRRGPSTLRAERANERVRRGDPSGHGTGGGRIQDGSTSGSGRTRGRRALGPRPEQAQAGRDRLRRGARGRGDAAQRPDAPRTPWRPSGCARPPRRTSNSPTGSVGASTNTSAGSTSRSSTRSSGPRPPSGSSEPYRRRPG